MKLPSGPREKYYSMNAKVVLSVALLCAVSCVKNEVSVTPLYNDNQIHFSPAPVRAHGTKADNSGKFSETNTFGSCAWYLPEGESWATDAKVGKGIKKPLELGFRGRCLRPAPPPLRSPPGLTVSSTNSVRWRCWPHWQFR